MRNYFILFGVFAWLAWGFLWLLPDKKELIKKHGADKGNDFFLALAKQGDPDALKLLKKTIFFIAVGFAGGLFIVGSKLI